MLRSVCGIESVLCIRNNKIDRKVYKTKNVKAYFVGLVNSLATSIIFSLSVTCARTF